MAFRNSVAALALSPARTAARPASYAARAASFPPVSTGACGMDHDNTSAARRASGVIGGSYSCGQA